MLKASHRHQSDALSLIEIGQKIDVGFRVRFPPRNGPKHTQVNQPRSFQLRLVRTQNPEDAFSIHSICLTLIFAPFWIHDKSQRS